MTIAVVTIAASAARAQTQAYLGKSKTSAAVITPLGPGSWSLDCAGYSGAEIRLGRRHRAITVHYIDGAVGGFALIQSDGRWAVYRRPDATSNTTKLVGFAVRRSPTRWDIIRGPRKIGYTVGPDGPEAATPLLTIC